MGLSESIVEEAALPWFLLREGSGGQVGELGYAVGHGPHQSRALATLRDTLLPKLLSGELSSDTRYQHKLIDP